MRDQSTAHGVRVGASSRAATNWLGLADQLAPEGFDLASDGLCIHRGGTVVYLCPTIRVLLGLESADVGVGSGLLELFSPRDRARVSVAINDAASDRAASDRAAGGTETGGRVTWLTLQGAPGIPRRVGLTARRVSSTIPPLDLLYVQNAPRGREGVPSGGHSPAAGAFGGERRAPGSAPTVLICDDEARLGALTAGLLADYGFVPVTVGTGEAAVDAIAARSPAVDVMLLDVNLSQGSSARQVLRTLSRFVGAPRVVLTSGLAEEDVDGDLREHPLVVGYVAKPYAVDELVKSLQSALGVPAGE